MIAPTAKAILENLADDLAAEMAYELLQQGHNNTGTLIESIRVKVRDTAFGVVIEGSNLDYGDYVDRGRRPGKMPPVNAIMDWVKQRGLASEEKQINSIAWAIATAIKKEGIPTSGANKYSKNGKRLNWVGEVLERKEDDILNALEAAYSEQFEFEISNLVRNTNKRLA